jgi:hypothetical protein
MSSALLVRQQTVYHGLGISMRYDKLQLLHFLEKNNGECMGVRWQFGQDFRQDFRCRNMELKCWKVWEVRVVQESFEVDR